MKETKRKRERQKKKKKTHEEKKPQQNDEWDLMKNEIHIKNCHASKSKLKHAVVKRKRERTIKEKKINTKSETRNARRHLNVWTLQCEQFSNVIILHIVCLYQSVFVWIVILTYFFCCCCYSFFFYFVCCCFSLSLFEYTMQCNAIYLHMYDSVVHPTRIQNNIAPSQFERGDSFHSFARFLYTLVRFFFIAFDQMENETWT